MTNKLLTAIAIGAMTLSASPVLAQSLENEPETFDRQIDGKANVDPARPFGNLQVDMDRDIQPGEFDETQLTELRVRCEFIMDNPQTYGPKPASFCEGRVQGLTQ